MNNKGNFLNLLGITIGFVLIIGLSLFLVLINYGWSYGFNILTNSLTSIETTNNVSNISYAASQVFTPLNNAAYSLRWISYLIIFSMFVGILISCFLVRMSAWYSLVYLLLYFILLFLSIYVSNSYEDIYSAGTDFSNGLQGWTGASYILLNLPVFISSLAAIGAIPLFVNLIRPREVE